MSETATNPCPRCGSAKCEVFASYPTVKGKVEPMASMQCQGRGCGFTLRKVCCAGDFANDREHLRQRWNLIEPIWKGAKP